MNTQVLMQPQSHSRMGRSFSLTPARGHLLQRQCACGGTPGPSGECEECKKKKLQRKANGPESGARNNSEVPPIVHEVLRSPGQPLNSATRAFMEPRFGHDFSNVRVHTDARAVESAQAVNAAAYTVGRDIIFGTGRHEPGSVEGQKLLAHELTHVVQNPLYAGQTEATSLRIGAPDSDLEREAQHASEQTANGLSLRAADGVQDILHRQPTPNSQPNTSNITSTLVASNNSAGCKKPESDYLRSTDYCQDSPLTGKLHLGPGKPWKRCYRQVPVRTEGRCPPGKHLCFDNEGNCGEEHQDEVAPFDRDSQGVCKWSPLRCVLKHLAADLIGLDQGRIETPFDSSAGRAESRVGAQGSATKTISESDNGARAGAGSPRRVLTSAEHAAAQLVFGTSLKLDRVVIQESALLTAPEGKFVRTLPNTIYVPPGMLNSIDTGLLVHELTHVWQYQNGQGLQVVIDAIRGRYDYGGEKGLKDADKAGKRFSDFNTEQQGDILRDYFTRVQGGLSVEAWLPFVNEVRREQNEPTYPTF